MDCEQFPKQGYGEFSERLHQKTARLHIPISGSIEVTQRCNLRCGHCYIPFPTRKGPREAELSLPEIQHVLDEIKAAGCLWLLLTGGEPFLRRDFLDIYKYAKRKGFILTLFTNGTLITPRIADTLSEWRPFNIEITLYGYSQATYERVTGIPGSHARCLRGIELLMERRLPLKLKTVLMTTNRDELGDMQAFAKSLGVEFIFDPILNPGLDGSVQPIALRLTPEEIVDVEKGDPGRASRWPEQFRQIVDFRFTDRKLYTCGAGNNSFHIDSFGRLCLCLTARQPSYELRAGSFHQGWEEFIPQLRLLEYGEDFACGSCELRAACAQCPALAQLEQGDPEKRVDFLCQVAHQRRDAFANDLLI